MLNERQFSSIENLLSYALTLDHNLHAFLVNWFDASSFLTVHTSGSTGKPKQIQLKKSHMINSAFASGTYFNLPPKTTALLCLPIAYIAGKMMLVRALVLGWHIDIIEATSHPLRDVKKEYKFGAMVPLQLQNSLKNIHYIEKLIVGGGVVSKELQEGLSDLETSVYATYGMTETITHIAVKKLNQFSNPRNSGQYYRVLPNITISKDNRGCLVIDAPKISDDIVVTNDLIELISVTEFKWLGRYDNIINSGGIKLVPEEIERKLSKIIESRFFVTGVTDVVLGEKLILIVESDAISADDISNNIQNLPSLGKFERPKEVHFLEQFIETETKKINRKKTIEKLFNL